MRMVLSNVSNFAEDCWEDTREKINYTRRQRKDRLLGLPSQTLSTLMIEIKNFNTSNVIWYIFISSDLSLRIRKE